jgi:hypothetical protein
MMKTIWMSYDLGVKGDYSSLYRWLDNHNAVECGDSLACFKIDIQNDEKVPDILEVDIGSQVELSKSDRIYIIWKSTDGINKGRFLFGKRKAAPWHGYGDTETDEDDL